MTEIKYYWTESSTPEYCIAEKVKVNEKITCYHCGESIEAGDPAIQLSTKSGDTYMIHLRCYRISCRDIVYSAEEEIVTLFRKLGIPAHILGYDYLKTAIISCLKDKNLLKGISTGLYPFIAEQHKTTSFRVERALRHAIELAWEHGDIETIYGIWGYTIQQGRRRPTNKVFITTIVNYLSSRK